MQRKKTRAEQLLMGFPLTDHKPEDSFFRILKPMGGPSHPTDSTHRLSQPLRRDGKRKERGVG
jgi:hypothetical protein